MRNKFYIFPVVFLLIGALSGWLTCLHNENPIRRDILVKARKYSYDPSVIEVNKNDTLHIKLVSLDVVHGFYVEGYDLDARISPQIKGFKIRKPSEGYNWKDTTEMVFVTNKTGKFRFRCSCTCGSMHPFMQGELIVKPNKLFNISVGAVIGFLFGMITMFYLRIRRIRNQKVNAD
jgi:heme/copper-type cytochrome/quinol oxidase subunit 2